MSDDMFAKLAAPFPPDAISWRVGSTTGDKTKGMALAFIDSRDVQDRLDAVCGPAGWQDEYTHAGEKTVCRISIKVGEDWIGKADGAGDTDYEAEKGALSAAFKRAAVKWGVGRYLYGLKAPWVEIEPAGPKSHKIKAHELPKLERLLKENAGIAAPTMTKTKARHDGDYYKLIAEINEHRASAALLVWGADQKERIAKQPGEFQDEIRREYAAKMSLLKGEEQQIIESESMGIRA